MNHDGTADDTELAGPLSTWSETLLGQKKGKIVQSQTSGIGFRGGPWSAPPRRTARCVFHAATSPPAGASAGIRPTAGVASDRRPDEGQKISRALTRHNGEHFHITNQIFTASATRHTYPQITGGFTNATPRWLRNETHCLPGRHNLCINRYRDGGIKPHLNCHGKLTSRNLSRFDGYCITKYGPLEIQSVIINSQNEPVWTYLITTDHTFYILLINGFHLSRYCECSFIKMNGFTFRL